MTFDINNILGELTAAGIISGIKTRCRPLAGGVSSEIYLIEEPNRRVIVKQALSRLKVQDLWQVDVRRNVVEQEFIRFVSTFLPEAMPRILYADSRRHYFVMEYLYGYQNWKSLLLSGNVSTALACEAGRIMGTLHNHTQGDRAVAKRFDTAENFHALRIDPYLLTTAAKHSALASQFEAEARRLAQCQRCLIHGDFSPKNVMIGQRRIILLDCEVACFGDPAFDLAFLFNHFFLKALLHRGRHQPFVQLALSAWSSYVKCFHSLPAEIEMHTVRLLLMLMLARIDGKSPVEYIDNEAKREVVRSFVYHALTQRVSTLRTICNFWTQYLDGKHAN